MRTWKAVLRTRLSENTGKHTAFFGLVVIEFSWDLCMAAYQHLILLLHHLEIAFGRLIFGKIIKIVATSHQILWLKCTKFYFDWGSAPDPAGRAYSAPRSPVAGFKGPTSEGIVGREGKGE